MTQSSLNPSLLVGKSEEDLENLVVALDSDVCVEIVNNSPFTRIFELSSLNAEVEIYASLSKHANSSELITLANETYNL